jgi:hypothetical protein
MSDSDAGSYRDSLLKLLRLSSLDFFNKGDLQKLILDRIPLTAAQPS